MRTHDWSRDQSRDIKTNNNLRLATCDQSQVACYATSRTITCDLRSVAGRMSQVAGLATRTMTDAQRKSLFCTYNVPVDTKKSCDPLCNSLCVKVYGYIGKSVCEREIKGLHGNDQNKVSTPRVEYKKPYQ
ncbi:hypothetical protein YC2023_077608 [Brassica napus]